MKNMITRSLALSAIASAVLAASSAGATTYSFDLTNKGTTTASALTFSSTEASSFKVKVTAWHAVDPNQGAVTTDAIKSATVGIWSAAGLGDLYGSDSTSSGTHQIDNVGGGEDFIMLQFDQDVTLSSLTRNVYSMTGVSCCDSDAAFWADTTHALGTPSNTATIALTNDTVDESLWTALAGTSASGVKSGTGSSASASVWLVSAAWNQSNDGFKVAGFSVTTPPPPPAVPEPATWASMIAGFGLVGGALRRRRAGLAIA